MEELHFLLVCTDLIYYQKTLFYLEKVESELPPERLLYDLVLDEYNYPNVDHI